MFFVEDGGLNKGLELLVDEDFGVNDLNRGNFLNLTFLILFNTELFKLVSFDSFDSVIVY